MIALFSIVYKSLMIKSRHIDSNSDMDKFFIVKRNEYNILVSMKICRNGSNNTG